MCVACRAVRPKREMVRVVRTPAGEILVDTTGKAAGRGAYVDAAPGCVDQAFRERRLQHALEAEIPERVREELTEVLSRPTPQPPKVIRIQAGQVQRATVEGAGRGG